MYFYLVAICTSRATECTLVRVFWINHTVAREKRYHRSWCALLPRLFVLRFRFGRPACWGKFREICPRWVRAVSRRRDNEIGKQSYGQECQSWQKNHTKLDVTYIRCKIEQVQVEGAPLGRNISRVSKRWFLVVGTTHYSFESEKGPKRVFYPLRVLVSERFVSFRGSSRR